MKHLLIIDQKKRKLKKIKNTKRKKKDIVKKKDTVIGKRREKIKNKNINTNQVGILHR